MTPGKLERNPSRLVPRHGWFDGVCGLLKRFAHRWPRPCPRRLGGHRCAVRPPWVVVVVVACFKPASVASRRPITRRRCPQTSHLAFVASFLQRPEEFGEPGTFADTQLGTDTKDPDHSTRARRAAPTIGPPGSLGRVPPLERGSAAVGR